MWLIFSFWFGLTCDWPENLVVQLNNYFFIGFESAFYSIEILVCLPPVFSYDPVMLIYKIRYKIRSALYLLLPLSSSFHLICLVDRFESLLFKLEVLDHKARERAGLITPTLGSPIPVLLRLETAIEVKLF